MAAVFYWPGVKQTDTIRNICGVWNGLPKREITLEMAVEMSMHAAQAAEVEHHGFVINIDAVREQKPGKYPNKILNNGFKRRPKNTFNRTCYECGGRGHNANICVTPDNRSIRKVCKKFPQKISHQ